MRKMPINIRLSCIALALLAAPAWGQNRCMPRPMAVAGLANSYSEQPVAVALSATGHLLEIFASPDGATWSAIMTNTQGISCFVAAGSNFELLEPGPAGEPG